MATMEESWQDWLAQELGRLGLKESSGYRDPAHNRAVGGAPGSYHTRGDAAHPGAIDVVGSEEGLRKLFADIKAMFTGRINELYLNVPGGVSSAIKNDRYLGTNPEAGRPQHLHVALGDATAPPPASGIPAENRGDKALAAAPADVCARSIDWTGPSGWVAAALGKDIPADARHSLCWSDIWFYGAAVGLVIGGSWLVFKGAGK